jgi:hypothetical protein
MFKATTVGRTGIREEVELDAFKFECRIKKFIKLSSSTKRPRKKPEICGIFTTHELLVRSKKG